MNLLTIRLAIFLVAASASAQGPGLAFSYRNPGGPATTLGANSILQFATVSVGATTQSILSIDNRSTVTYSLTQIALTGEGFSGDIRVPIDLRPGESTQVALSFTPRSPNQTNGTITIQATTGSGSANFVFFLRGTGVAQEMTASYIVNPNGNQLPLSDGTTIPFTPVQPGQTSTVTIVVQNRGTATGTIDRVVVGGDGFQVTGLPLLPASLAPERELRFGVAFMPASNERQTGTLVLQLAGSVTTIALQGTGISSVLRYEYAIGAETRPVANNGTVLFADTPVGTPQTIIFRVHNTGAAPGRLAAATVTGTGFRVVEVPILPATIGPGETAEIVLSYTPPEPGELRGRLRTDVAAFDLVGNGLGPKLGYLATVENSTTTLVPNGTMIFTNIAVGASLAADVRIENSGNRPATINSIAITGAAFRAGILPPLPATIGPAESVTVRILAAPDALGVLNGTLQIDETRFTLRVTGAQPPPVPDVTINLSTTAAEPMQQPTAGVSISSPYNADLSGKLNLAFASETFTDDPAIQFPAGGRSVVFRIPAGSTEAVFADGARQVLFQTGTVAGAITLSASLTVVTVDVTPTPAPARALSIAAGAPHIRGLQIVPRSQGSFDLVISGYSTPRSVSSLHFNFAAAPGARLQTDSLTAQVESAFASWFESPTSRQFGSQFVATVNVLINGELSTINSVTVTAANSRGSSTPVTGNFR